MAFLPCDHGTHPFRGKSTTVYSALSIGSEMDRTKLRLCPEHAAVLGAVLEPYEVPEDRTGAEDWLVSDCMSCGHESDPESRRMLFVTAYFVGEDRRDYWSGLHTSCPMPSVLRPGTPAQ